MNRFYNSFFFLPIELNSRFKFRFFKVVHLEKRNEDEKKNGIIPGELKKRIKIVLIFRLV